jgi:hypothetical protein
MSDNFERPHASDEGIGLTQPESEKSETAFADHRSAWGTSLRRHLPYVLVLGLATVGVAYTNMAHQPLVGYWEFLALATGLVHRLRHRRRRRSAELEGAATAGEPHPGAMAKLSDKQGSECSPCHPAGWAPRSALGFARVPF